VTGASAAVAALRVVLRQPQRRQGRPHLSAVALAGAQPGEDGFGAFGLAESHEGLQHVRSHPRSEGLRRDERAGQPLGGLLH
jgi:hypothetical protein